MLKNIVVAWTFVVSMPVHSVLAMVFRHVDTCIYTLSDAHEYERTQ